MTKAIAAATLISLALVGCAHTEFPPVTVKAAPVGTARIPLTVAVLDDPSITVHPLLDFYEKMNPAMANAVRDALAENFEKVIVVDDSKSPGGGIYLRCPRSSYPTTRKPSR
jgi:hypothetical protein